MGGKICDSCRSLFYTDDTIREVCSKCFNNVWCVINIYEDDSKELSSIHHTEEAALNFVLKNAMLITRINAGSTNKIKEQKVTKWAVL